MTELDEQFKEGIFENSEFKLLKQIIDLLDNNNNNNNNVNNITQSNQRSLHSFPIQIHQQQDEHNNNNNHNTKLAKQRVYSNSSSSSNTKYTINNDSSNKNNSNSNIRLLKDFADENDDDYIIEVDGGDDTDLDKLESQEEEENEHDDDDDVEYGQSSKNNKQNYEISSKITTKLVEIDDYNTNNNYEIQILDKFKTIYQNEYNFGEHKLEKYFEKIFLLILNKRLCCETWLNNSQNNSTRSIYLTLYCLRILLRNESFQNRFLSFKYSFNSLAKLFRKYVNFYSTVHNQIIIYSHILDQLLNILNKIYIYLNSNNSSSKQLSLIKEINRLFFDEFKLHVSLIQLIETTNEICLIHSALNLLIQISSIEIENRTKLANDLDISDQLLLILQEYDEDSKKFASKLLCLLCIDEKIKSEVTNLDGIQVLLSLLHMHNNLDVLWNAIWCLVQLSSYEDNKKEIRLMGGIPLILSILCDRELDEESTNTENNNDSNNDKRFKAKLQIQAACCALVGELAFNETNSYQIVNTNGVYLVASKLLINSGIEQKEIERLHSNVWRTIRILFSADRHRSLIKKIIPFNMFEQFVDIGNYKKDLKLYQSLVESFSKLSKDELDLFYQLIKSCNQSQTPTNYINDYAVYEIIGSGAFGRVYKVKKKNANYFLAMKEINTYNLSTMKDKSLGEIVNEVTIIRNNLKHPNIVRYLKTFKESDNLYIVMELIDGTPLSQHVRKLKEKQELWNEDKVWNIFIQIVLALKYLHKEKHIVHRDLTSNNIMLSENEKITITDFGLAKLKESDCSKMLSVVGTMFYSCPEIIKNEPYNEKADIWAIGCVLYEICCLEPPFCTSNMLALATKITQSDYDHSKLSRNSYSTQISQVVQNCLIVDPVKRPDIVNVASLIAEKILTYTDSIRNKCIYLEKKLEKEKNKTQKYFCNKQDMMNNYNNHRNNNNLNSKQLNSTNSNNNEQDENLTAALQNLSIVPSSPSIGYTSLSFLTPQVKNVSNPSLRQRSESIKSENFSLSEQNKSNNNNNSNNNNSSPNSSFNNNNNNSSANNKDSTVASTTSSSAASPNAKLPPIRHPKSKLIMKNIQNKQLQHQNSIEQSQNTPTQPKPIDMTLINANNLEQKQQPSSSDSKSNNSNNNNKITRSSSSSVLEKRSNQLKKSRPNSANSPMVPVYKKLRPIEDPIIQILDQIHKILFITQLPPSGKKNFKRKLVDRYKRALFCNKKSSMQIKDELMKLIKNSNELIDNEMIGLKNFQFCFNTSSDCNSQRQLQSNYSISSENAQNFDSYSFDLDMIINQNSITYEQLQNIIEDLLIENNYHSIDSSKHLREDLPSID